MERPDYDRLFTQFKPHPDCKTCKAHGEGHVSRETAIHMMSSYLLTLVGPGRNWKVVMCDDGGDGVTAGVVANVATDHDINVLFSEWGKG